MRDSIRLSERYGANLALGVCFWCGKEDGTVLLLGRLPGDAEAPRRVASSYEPCEACRKVWAKGVAFIEATRRPQHDGQVPLAEQVYPTGRLLVLTIDVAMKIVQPREMMEQVTRLQKAFVEPPAFAKLLSKIDRD